MRLVLTAITVTMLVTSVAHADTRPWLDDLLPLTDTQPSVVVQPHVDMPATATATEHRPDRRWQSIDIAALAVSTAALAIDWRQTRSAAAERWSGGDRAEVGTAAMFIGSQPSSGSVDRYFAVVAAANVVLWAVLPPRWRSVIPGVVIGVEARTIAVNLPTTRL